MDHTDLLLAYIVEKLIGRIQVMTVDNILKTNLLQKSTGKHGWQLQRNMTAKMGNKWNEASGNILANVLCYSSLIGLQLI